MAQFSMSNPGTLAKSSAGIPKMGISTYLLSPVTHLYFHAILILSETLEITGCLTLNYNRED